MHRRGCALNQSSASILGGRIVLIVWPSCGVTEHEACGVERINNRREPGIIRLFPIYSADLIWIDHLSVT